MASFSFFFDFSWFGAIWSPDPGQMAHDSTFFVHMHLISNQGINLDLIKAGSRTKHSAHAICRKSNALVHELKPNKWVFGSSGWRKHNTGFWQPHTAWSVRIWSYSGPHFPAFGLHTKKYSVSLRIQSEYRKKRTRITLNTDTFYEVSVCLFLEKYDEPSESVAFLKIEIFYRPE